jgi:signal transduction histidine kinase
MWKRFSLRTRILVLLALIMGITVGGGVVSMINSYMMDRIFSSVMESDLEAVHAAQELENTLVMQKGYVTYYFQDSDDAWLRELDRYHLAFESWLRKARQWAVTDEERAILSMVDSKYADYSHTRDEVVKLYKEGKRDDGFRLHQQLRNEFRGIIDLSRKFKDAYGQSIMAARGKINDRVGLMSALTIMALLLAIILAGVLSYILFMEILEPIRQLALGSENLETTSGVGDEVKVLRQRFQNLIEDVDQTKSKLKRSREHLAQAEKWALVGKLAAGVAHSVRNPLTSVKMRLFSMERNLLLAASQKEDFEVISEEIRHIDTIVGNFLEFSRPPRLRIQSISPSDTVDMAIQLLKHRLESYNVTVEVVRDEQVPDIHGDPDQLKEVLVNLMANACEAIVDGGVITIKEKRTLVENVGLCIVIQMTDTGPGVPEEIQDKLFQPFFSTKEEGTGLGLSIATRIVEEHGGWIELRSREGEGATFIITLPVRETERWETSS